MANDPKRQLAGCVVQERGARAAMRVDRHRSLTKVVGAVAVGEVVDGGAVGCTDGLGNDGPTPMAVSADDCQ